MMASSNDLDLFHEAAPQNLHELETQGGLSTSTSTTTLDSYVTGVQESSPSSPDLLAEDIDLLQINATPTLTRQKTLLEFDPLSLPKQGDWMINFESPVANSAAPPAEQAVQDHCLLIDSVTATPKSIAKYTMHDLEEFQQEWRRKSEKEFELIQLELAESEAERIKLVEGRKEMESTLAAWDTAMSRMIDERESDRMDHRREVEMLKVQIEKLVGEKDRVQKEADIINNKYKQSRIDNEDLKELEADLALTQKRYEALKAHATEKLNAANVEIHKVRTTFEKDLQFVKSKLSRAELQTQSLEKAVEMKTAENEELTKICDELVAQIENMQKAE